MEHEMSDITDDLTDHLAKAIQAKTGGNVEGKLPEWWAEFIDMVLAELQSAGRLVPAGGMALTAEQVDGLKFALEAVTSVADVVPELRGTLSTPISRLVKFLRALFPATEPAEDSVGDPLQAWKDFLKPKPIGWYRTMELDFAAKHFGFPSNPVFEDRYTAPDGGKWQWTDELQWELREYPPAPAEPAEEETKAERGPEWFREIADAVDEIEKIPGMYHSMTLRSWAGVFRNHADTLELASSPVVPAPTETGPWQTWQEVPNDTPFWSRDKRETNSWWWIKRSTEHRKELRQADSCGETVHLGPTSFMNEFAPFVAAEGN